MSADVKNLSIEELKKIDKLRTQEFKNKYNQYKEKQEQRERQKLIERIKKKESLINKYLLFLNIHHNESQNLSYQAPK